MPLLLAVRYVWSRVSTAAPILSTNAITVFTRPYRAAVISAVAPRYTRLTHRQQPSIVARQSYLSHDCFHNTTSALFINSSPHTQQPVRIISCRQSIHRDSPFTVQTAHCGVVRSDANEDRVLQARSVRLSACRVSRKVLPSEVCGRARSPMGPAIIEC
jgi:hypothetical protein